MNYKQVCDDFVKYKNLDLTGKEFFDLDPSGHLTHVWVAREIMINEEHPNYVGQETWQAAFDKFMKEREK